jgi:hypothetical protein
MKENQLKSESGSTNREESLEEKLNRYPKLKSRVESLLAVVENAAGDLDKADAAEQRVIEEVRQMGNEVLHDWARSQERKKSEELEKSEQAVCRKGKKSSTGRRGSGR